MKKLLTLLTVICLAFTTQAQPCIGCTHQQLGEMFYEQSDTWEKGVTSSGSVFYYAETTNIIRVWDMYYNVCRGYSIVFKNTETYNKYINELDKRAIRDTVKNQWYLDRLLIRETMDNKKHILIFTTNN